MKLNYSQIKFTKKYENTRHREPRESTNNRNGPTKLQMLYLIETKYKLPCFSIFKKIKNIFKMCAENERKKEKERKKEGRKKDKAF